MLKENTTTIKKNSSIFRAHNIYTYLLRLQRTFIISTTKRKKLKRQTREEAEMLFRYTLKVSPSQGR